MIKKAVCTECPVGCILAIETGLGLPVKIAGNKCPKGEEYALSEIKNPLRILTSTVLTAGLSLKMLPVRTDKAIPRNSLIEAMKEVRKLKVTKPVQAGEIIVKDFPVRGVNLIATRAVF